MYAAFLHFYHCAVQWGYSTQTQYYHDGEFMPDLAVYPQSDLPEVLKWQALAFIKTEWPFVFSGEDQFLTEPCPPDLYPVHFVATEGDSLIGYASIFRLNIDHAGTSYEIYAFGNMFTFPPYRKQGYGKRILNLATDFIKNSEVDAGTLFCESNVEPFYQACGWQTAGAPARIGTPDDYKQHDHILTMNLYVSEKGLQGKSKFDEQPLYVKWLW
jgi:GNAT superfamily N-acetyltransferase